MVRERLFVVASLVGRAQALGRVGFNSWAQQFWRAGCREQGHRLSCSEAGGIFLEQGSILRPLSWQADSEPLNHQGRPQHQFLVNSFPGRAKSF